MVLDEELRSLCPFTCCTPHANKFRTAVSAALLGFLFVKSPMTEMAMATLLYLCRGQLKFNQLI